MSQSVNCGSDPDAAVAGCGCAAEVFAAEATGGFGNLPLVVRIAVWVLALDVIVVGGAFLLAAAGALIGLLFD